MNKIKYYLVTLLILACSTITPLMAGEKSNKLETATFAGGCFWCMEKPFDVLEGVISTTSGYTGGRVPNPTYKQVSSGSTGHAEAVQVIYDPDKISYQQLLDIFWRQINPTTPDQQFVDIGSQYRSEIFYHTDEQRRLAEASRQALDKRKIFSKPIVTPITPASTFYPAEAYHQDYYKKNPFRYKFYRSRSGRDQFLDTIWGSEGH
jgi:peptide methionine sulfoxide reductase msrA/msrB